METEHIPITFSTSSLPEFNDFKVSIEKIEADYFVHTVQNNLGSFDKQSSQLSRLEKQVYPMLISHIKKRDKFVKIEIQNK